jgi:photosystem II stability/assembly factor-like uncharacterized protein
MGMLAAALVVALVVAASGVSLALNDLAHRAAPAGQSHFRPATEAATVVGLSAFSAVDAAVWGPYNAMATTQPKVDSLDSSGLLITHDGGKTWLATGLESNAPDTETVSWTSWTDSERIAVVDANSIHITSDGGLTWRQIERPPLPSPPRTVSLDFTFRVSGSAIFLIGDASHLYVTQDGGATWVGSVLPPPPGGLPTGIWFQYYGPFMFGGRGVFALSSPAMSYSLIYTTSDGGHTWLGPISETGESFAALSPNDWWVVNRTGHVFRTVDAGSSWNLMPITPNYSVLTLTSVFPTGGNVLWGIGNGSVMSGMPLRSTDAGAHWSIVKLP